MVSISGGGCRPLSPLVRWAGSKRQLLPSLVSAAPANFGRYIEPFSGSACLFFALRPTRGILGDINAELLQTYAAVREYPGLVAELLKELPRSERRYYEIRSMNPSTLGPIVRAVRFLYLNRYCFNAVYRTNRRGEFNVPFGTRTGGFPTITEFHEIARALSRAELRIGDFQECLKDVQKGDFVYLDPPYATSCSRWRGEYGPNPFSEHDLRRLSTTLSHIDSVGGRFLLSYVACPEVATLGREWYQRELQVRRHVAGFARHRGEVTELLISNSPGLLRR